MEGSHPAPPGWGKDAVSDFIQTAHLNTFATFRHLPEDWRRFVGIDMAYRKAIDALENSKAWFEGFFLLGAHSSFLGAVRLAASTQLPETYMILRGCLENSLYGFFIHEHPELAEVWLKRHEDETSKGRVKSEFQIAPMLDLLDLKDKTTGKAVRELYERTIDYGAHPNERALTQNLRMTKETGATKFLRNYLSGDGPALRLCLKTTAQVGVSSLLIFQLVIPERFKLLGLTDALSSLSKGL